MIPVLMITYNRIEYTKIALDSLRKSKEVQVIIIDNASTDGTVEWLKKIKWNPTIKVYFNKTNLGVSGAMNQFKTLTLGAEYVGKVDNDTCVAPNWARSLREYARALKLDIIQAKHQLIKEVAFGKSFDQWVSTMTAATNFPEIRYHHFVGGSGILIRRDIFGRIPETDWKLYGWRQYQREHPHLIKAFCTSVEVSLLDSGGAGARDYPAYYKETGRIVNANR